MSAKELLKMELWHYRDKAVALPDYEQDMALRNEAHSPHGMHGLGLLCWESKRLAPDKLEYRLTVWMDNLQNMQYAEYLRLTKRMGTQSFRGLRKQLMNTGARGLKLHTVGTAAPNTIVVMDYSCIRTFERST